ncbi:type II inositol 3,4-bisphosphate 4-phosphatase-like [Xenia sp. Carnegie-2017]|uniref:type II inositol 3,4-bisphosphate 4-phosphatase-like n=1 Tax=Xenia sp. Carnegie-2017 TaxID=2897299 RepID=UPI001F042498|nr:type II inositol 3,4-bisphosphate 4-phosphatase-like [Xenia sp. Carnegie-2017]
MRFNQKELAFLALQPAETFDLEGSLWLKEKEGYFWQRNESYTERWCRLKGNLLFYCKTNEKLSEPAGLLVLERCHITKDASSSRKHAFILAFDRQDESQHYHFAANSEAEYNDWTTRIVGASYEKLKEKLQKLCEQITEITGKHPLPQNHPHRNDSFIMSALPSVIPVQEDSPFLEISIGCNSLKQSIENRDPNAVVHVSTMTPPGAKWTRLTQTEIIEKTTDPCFLTTVSVPSGPNFSEVTRLKFAVFDVRDRVKEEMTHLGQAVCTIKDVLSSSNQKIQLSLTGLDSPTPSGTITLLGWKMGTSTNDKSAALSCNNDKLKSRPSTTNRPKLDSVLQRAFTIPTSKDTSVIVMDIMGESYLTFTVPQQMLKIFITEEKQKILDLNNLGNLMPEWDNVRQEILDDHFNLVSKYTDRYRHLNSLRERQDNVSSRGNFKPSRLKTDKTLAFVTTNLHLQRLKVIDGTNEQVYDVVTFGAPSAHSMKFGKGGLRKLLGTPSTSDRLVRARNMKGDLDMLHHTIQSLCEEMKRALLNKDLKYMDEISKKIKEKAENLMNFREMTFIVESLTRLSTSRPSFEDRTGSFSSSAESDKNENPECKVLVDTIRNSSNHMLVLIADSGEAQPSEVRHLSSIKNLVSDISRAVESLIKEFKLGLNFVLLQEESRSPQTMKNLRQRRDICLSQAVTALICGFEAKVYTCLFNTTFMKQLCQIGVLAEFECLLSTYGDEMGMLEDMSTAIRDLSSVKFRFARSDDDNIPYVTGTRTNIQVTILLPTEYFCHLPEQLQEGQQVRVYSVLFCQGINEHATLAERFGDTSLQETINEENFSVTNFYYQQFREHFPDEANASNSSEPVLNTLVEHLKSNIAAKKSKNVEILFLAQEICWRMNGIRFTSCKSAKDRTSMSITLEQCLILKRKYRLALDIFNRAIDAMRSEGTRRENCFKNAGVRRYAFNYWQMMALPRLYRPPDGTYGKNIQT